MLIDEITIKVQAGKGADGFVSFGPRMGSGPDGGDGGNGGDVYAVATSDVTVLKNFAQNKTYRGGDGQKGWRFKRKGAKGKDLELIFPVGTKLKNLKTGREIEIDSLDDRILLCQGGQGGHGNFELRSSTNTTPEEAESGENGDFKKFKVVLRLIADCGLVGLPSVGKSSLLNELTKARVKTAAYHFTTLEPNLGALEGGKIIADIPGLIKGASKGKGLGFKFLKHVEKVSVLLHCLGLDRQDIKKDYEIIRQELGDFNKNLLDKKEIILLTKSDLVKEKEIKAKLKIAKKLAKKVFVVSIHDYNSIEKLKKFLI